MLPQLHELALGGGHFLELLVEALRGYRTEIGFLFSLGQDIKLFSDIELQPVPAGSRL